MSDDESARPAAEPAPAEPTAPNPADPSPSGPTTPAEPGSTPELGSTPEPAQASGPAADAAEQAPTVAEQAPTAAEPKAPGKVAAFLKANVPALVLAALLVGAIVWGVLGTASAKDWESRATALSSDLASAEQTLADAEATIDDLETAKSRAESTATACVGAIDDADDMLEVSAELDEKTVVYMEGLNDFMTALNAGNLAAAETVGTEIDKLSVQMEDLSEQVEGHIDDYADSAEGCHVDDAQDV
jgi:Tfp pilus assembly protein PilX